MFSQGGIRGKLILYLKARDIIERIVKNQAIEDLTSGHCHGLGVLWGFAKHLSKLPELGKRAACDTPSDNLDWFHFVIDTLYRWRPGIDMLPTRTIGSRLVVDYTQPLVVNGAIIAEVERFLSLILALQNPKLVHTKLTQGNILDLMQFVYQGQTYQMIEICKFFEQVERKNLASLLEQYTPNRGLAFVSLYPKKSAHAVTIYRSDDSYYLYDSNDDHRDYLMAGDIFYQRCSDQPLSAEDAALKLCKIVEDFNQSDGIETGSKIRLGLQATSLVNDTLGRQVNRDLKFYRDCGYSFVAAATQATGNFVASIIPGPAPKRSPLHQYASPALTLDSGAFSSSSPQMVIVAEDLQDEESLLDVESLQDVESDRDDESMNTSLRVS